MPFNLSDWLFDTGIGPDGNIENFRYFWPFLIFCGVGLLIWFYYWVEGRKRFLNSSHYVKTSLDRYLNWLAIICFVGIPIALSRITLEGFFFAWRFWRILWLVALLVWAVLLIVYLVRNLPKDKVKDTDLAKIREDEKDRGKNKNKNKSNKQKHDKRLTSRSR